MKNKSTFSMTAFMYILFCGASIPFILTGFRFEEKNQSENTPEIIARYGIIKPPLEILIEDDATLDILAESNVPKYSILVRQLKHVNKIHTSFLSGNVSLWNSIVLIAAIVAAQWSSGAMIYYLTRKPVLDLYIVLFNFLCVTLGLLAGPMVAIFPILEWLSYFVYYILPIPVIFLWAVFGIVYLRGILDDNENILALIFYSLWHYCGIFVLYQVLTNCNNPWL